MAFERTTKILMEDGSNLETRLSQLGTMSNQNSNDVNITGGSVVIAGKSLSEEDFTTALSTKLTDLPENTTLQEELDTKLGVTNIIAGDGITLDVTGNDITVNSAVGTDVNLGVTTTATTVTVTNTDGTDAILSAATATDAGVLTSTLFTKVDELPDNATLQSDFENKQDQLVSGTNIKTINSTSLLGEGNISIPIVDNTTSNIYEGTLSSDMVLSSDYEKCFIMPDGNSLVGVKEQSYVFSGDYDTDTMEIYLVMPSDTQTEFKVRFQEFRIQTAPYAENIAEAGNSNARYPLSGFATLKTNTLYTVRKASFQGDVLLIVG